MPHQPFWERLKAWRKCRRLTQRQAAEKLGANARTLQGWEQGAHEPTAALRKLIEVKLGKA